MSIFLSRHLTFYLLLISAATLLDPGVSSAAGRDVGEHILDFDSSCWVQFDHATWADQDGLYDSSMSTYRRFIESCASVPRSWQAFIAMDGENAARQTTNWARFEEHRNWLKSVLYLNRVDTMYYCEDAESILHTFSWFNDQRGVDINGICAVTKYLLESKRCPFFDSLLRVSYVHARFDQYRSWQDSVKVDTNIYKLDTTLPSLEELGLGILRGPEAVSASAAESSLDPIVLHATANPFKRETEIWYDLSRTRMIRLQLFDPLGREMQEFTKSETEAPGRHEFSIDAEHLVAGSYYARLSTFDGEVRTIKIVKE